MIYGSHTEMTVPKLGAACFTIRAGESYMTCDTIKMIYYFYFMHLWTMVWYSGEIPHTTIVFSKY